MLDFTRTVLDFVIFTVVVKMIVGHWMAEALLRYFNKFFNSAERNARLKAIWQHFQLRAKGDGHIASNILQCRDGNCVTL